MLETNFMKKEEIYKLLDQYMKKYDWKLFARCSTASSSPAEEQDTYSYEFMDNLGIDISIDPVTKSFQFSKIVGTLFHLKSDEYSPLTYEGHFERFYMKFRAFVTEKELN